MKDWWTLISWTNLTLLVVAVYAIYTLWRWTGEKATSMTCAIC